MVGDALGCEWNPAGDQALRPSEFLFVIRTIRLTLGRQSCTWWQNLKNSMDTIIWNSGEIEQTELTIELYRTSSHSIILWHNKEV